MFIISAVGVLLLSIVPIVSYDYLPYNRTLVIPFFIDHENVSDDSKSELRYVFDPVVVDIDTSLYDLCSKFDCGVNDNRQHMLAEVSRRWELKMIHQLRAIDFYQYYALETYTRCSFVNDGLAEGVDSHDTDLPKRWVLKADEKCRVLCSERKRTVSNILNLWKFQGSMTEYDTQLFLQSSIRAIVSEQISRDKYASNFNLAINQSQLLESISDTDVDHFWSRWTFAAELLFNKQLYDEALSMSIALLLHLEAIYDISHTVNGHVELEDYDKHIEDRLDDRNLFKCKVYLILAETSRMKNLLDWSSFWTIQIIVSYSRFTKISGYIPTAVPIYRFRLITLIPSMPPSYEISLAHRKLMVQDLNQFSAVFKAKQYSLKFNQIINDISSTPFNLAHQGINDLEVQIALYNSFTTMAPSIVQYAAHVLNPSHTMNDDQESTPIKIGLASAHFYDHSIGNIMIQLLAYLHEIATSNAQLLEVTVFFIDYKLPVDINDLHAFNSNIENRYLGTQCKISNLLRSILGDRFKQVPADMPMVRDYIASHELDFLLYTDVGMEATTYFLAMSRLATYQAVWWGHPITSGIPTIDFYFGLDTEIEDAGNAHYSEQLVRMSHINTIPLAKLPTTEENRQESLKLLGLPPGALFCMVLGRLFKFHPTFDELLASVLIELPHESYIVLVAETFHDYNEIILDRIFRILSHNNHSDKIDRLKFSDYSYYAVHLPYARVVLDTFPYGGCITSHDAISNGVPTVTLPLEHARGRYTYAIYKQMGHMDLVADDAKHYVSLVSQLLTNQTFYSIQSEKIHLHFRDNANRNREIATEWLQFVLKLFR